MVGGRVKRVLGVCAAAVLVSSACSASESSGGADLESRLAAAKTALDEAASVEFTLAADGLPDGVAGVELAEGVGTHAPAFEGEITISGGGILDGQTVKVVSVDGEVYANAAFTSSYFAVDPADFGAPDPAALIDPDSGVSTLLTEANDLQDEGESREGDTVVTELSGSVPGKVLARIFPTASAGDPYDVLFTVTDENDVRGLTVAGAFYGKGGNVTYDLTFDPSDEEVEITKP
ncbi:MAG: LppX_LprAFG lipoprotein [Propionibacteriales bacterium]|nr:LppX_LprAFG lipoprotein [Propionibacteriales bacterium]